jgi:thioredoxin reductase (NADPH)
VQPRTIEWDAIPVQDVIIIGSGPAGATAGLYLGRAGYKPLIFHGQVAGGQLTLTHEVENFPTFRGTGTQLMKAIHRQANESGCEFVAEAIQSANLTLFPRQFLSDLGEPYRSRAVILATGAVPRFLGLESEKRLKNKGVSACAICDGVLFTGQDVAVVGGGDTAVTEALSLKKICDKVSLIHRKSSLTASTVMQAKLKDSGIDVYPSSEVVEIMGEEFVTGVKFRNLKTKELRTLKLSAVFIAIGRIPATDVFKHEIEVDSYGYFEKVGNTTATNVPGVFVAGDCADPMYRQAITSAGTGCQAALDAERWLIQNTVVKRPKVKPK